MSDLNRREVLRLAAGALAGLGLQHRTAAAADGDLVRYGPAKTYRLTHRAVVTGGTVPLVSLELWLPVPQNQPEQTVDQVTVDPRVPLVPDKTGQALVARRFARTGLPGSDRTWSLEVSYRIACRAILARWPAIDRTLLGDYTKDQQFETFTRPEKYVESDLAEIVAQAEKLRTKHRGLLSFVRAAYDWVLDRTQYKLIEGLGGAAYCLNNGHGECGDYTALWVALCRAAGVPARLVSGFWADKTDGWHVWGEFMLPGGLWLPVDPAVGDRGRWNRRWYFGSTDDRRVAACKTLSVDLTGKSLGQMKHDFLQSGCFWWRGRAAPDARHPTVKFTVEGRRADR